MIRKKQKEFHLYNKCVNSPLNEPVNQTSFPFSFYTLLVYSKAAWFFQSPTTVFSSFSTLDKIQFLWV